MSKGKQKSYSQPIDAAEMKPTTFFVAENPLGEDAVDARDRAEGELTLKSFISITEKKIRYFI
jgi:hypothetical protein